MVHTCVKRFLFLCFFTVSMLIAVTYYMLSKGPCMDFLPAPTNIHRDCETVLTSKNTPRVHNTFLALGPPSPESSPHYQPSQMTRYPPNFSKALTSSSGLQTRLNRADKFSKLMQRSSKVQATDLLPTSTPGLLPDGELSTVAEECPCPFLPEEVNVKIVAMEMETHEDLLIGFFRYNNLKAEKALGRRQELLDPEFEAPLFVFPPLRHSVCLPDHSRSQVHLLTTAEQLSVGSAVQFRIDLYNGCGQPRFTGGDEVRAWIKSQDGHSSVAARVKDLHNGSYVGETILPWPGLTSVRVSLTYAREFLQFSVEMYHRLHSMRWTTETLQYGDLSERVPCLPSAPIPGYAKVCNFTGANGGRPWYCGHPVTKGLNCSHRSLYDNLPYTGPLPVPRELMGYVKKVIGCCPNEENADLRLIPNGILLNFVDGTQPFPPRSLPPCSSRPLSESWLPPPLSPRGWLRQGHWYPSTCTLPPPTDERVQRCLMNTTVILHGDSNQRMLWRHLVDSVGCTDISESYWNAPHICVNAAMGCTLMQMSHAFPFSPGTHGNFPIANLPLPYAIPFSTYFNPLTPHHRVVVVLHYYLHPSTHPVHVYRTLVQRARATVQKYLKVYPGSKFVVRGPHVMYRGNHHHVHIGDKFAPWYQRIWREEFAELWDRVWYMDTWDLTLAAENVYTHPLPLMPEIARILLGYICDDE